MDLIQNYLFSTSIITPAILATLFTTLLFLYHLCCKKPAHSRRQTTEATGAWPIIGHLHLFMGSKPPHITLGHMADKLGPIFTIRMGLKQQALVVSSSELARECFTTNDKAFASRPKSIAWEVMTYNYAMFAFDPYGPYWRKVRTMTKVELLSNHRVDSFRLVRESEVKSALKELHQLCANDSSTQVGTEMTKWFSDLTLNMVFRILVGKRYMEAMLTSEGESGEAYSERYRKVMRDFFELIGSFVVADAIPWLRWLDLGGHERAMRKTMRELDQLVQRWLEEHKRKQVSGEGSDNTFMALILSNVDDAEFGTFNYDADTINKSTIVVMILAGTDTTTLTMIWALSLLLNNKETLKKAQQEIDQHVGRDRQVQESDLKNLVYLRAILKETLRLYPAAPLSVPHESIEDCVVSGYHVPAGTRLIVNLSKLHRDPNVWEDPDEFRPERFLSGEGKNIDVKGQNYELMPFGSGRRMCPGVSFALHLTELTLASLIQAFDITTPFDKQIDMAESTGMTNLKASPLNVLLTPRLSSYIY